MVTVKTLASYVFAAMIAWVPPSNHSFYEPEEQTQKRYTSIANDIASVALMPTEKPLFNGDDESARIKTSLLLASFAAYESSYKSSVDVGKERGDHGTAWCLMQIRPMGGLFLTTDTYVRAASMSKSWKDDNATKIIYGNDLVQNRKLCFTTALHILRNDGIYAYIGESKGGKRAENRLNKAKSWFTTHEFRNTNEDR